MRRLGAVRQTERRFAQRVGSRQFVAPLTYQTASDSFGFDMVPKKCRPGTMGQIMPSPSDPPLTPLTACEQRAECLDFITVTSRW